MCGKVCNGGIYRRNRRRYRRNWASHWRRRGRESDLNAAISLIAKRLNCLWNSFPFFRQMTQRVCVHFLYNNGHCLLSMPAVMAASFRPGRCESAPCWAYSPTPVRCWVAVFSHSCRLMGFPASGAFLFWARRRLTAAAAPAARRQAGSLMVALQKMLFLLQRGQRSTQDSHIRHRIGSPVCCCFLLPWPVLEPALVILLQDSEHIRLPQRQSRWEFNSSSLLTAMAYFSIIVYEGSLIFALLR